MSLPPVKTLPLGEFRFMQVKWIVGLLVLVSWDWHLHFFRVQQEKPGRMQMTPPPQSCRLAPAGAATSMGPRKHNGFGSMHFHRVVICVSPHPFHRRAPGRRLTRSPRISGCSPNPLFPTGLSGTRAEEDFPLRMHEVFVPRWTTQGHRNVPGIWSAGTNRRAWLK